MINNERLKILILFSLLSAVVPWWLIALMLGFKPVGLYELLSWKQFIMYLIVQTLRVVLVYLYRWWTTTQKSLHTKNLRLTVNLLWILEIHVFSAFFSFFLLLLLSFSPLPNSQPFSVGEERKHSQGKDVCFLY